MVAPAKDLRPHERREWFDDPRPIVPTIIQCRGCGYDVPREEFPPSDGLLRLLGNCPKCYSFAWESIDARAVALPGKPMPYEPCPHCKANRAGIQKHMACAFCGLTLCPRWGVDRSSEE